MNRSRSPLAPASHEEAPRTAPPPRATKARSSHKSDKVAKRAVNAVPRLTGKLEMATEFGVFVGDARIRLLEAIVAHGSISKAAKHVPMSYKAAWDAVDAMNNLSDQALVERSTGGRHGGGTVLTPQGLKVIGLYRAVEAEYQLALDRLTAQWGEVHAVAGAGGVRAFQQLLRRLAMRTSARNQFACTVTSLRLDALNCEVGLRLDAENGPDGADDGAAQTLQATITRDSAEQLGLSEGQSVVALVKASAVQLLPDAGQRRRTGKASGAARRQPPCNRLHGTVERVVPGPAHAEVVLGLGGGKTVTAVVPGATVADLGLAVGQPACAVFQAAHVILSVLG